MSFNYNHVTLVGRIKKEPEHKFIREINMTTFNLSIDRPYRQEDGTVKTDLIPIKMYGKLAQIAQHFIKKDTPLLIEGRLETKEYELNGERRWITSVLCENFQILA